MDKVAVALAILNNDELLDEMDKDAGVLKGVANVMRAGDEAGRAASKFLQSKGHKNLAVAARVTPHALAAVGAKKAYDSETAQKLRRKYQAYKYRKAMERAQRGY
jgi:hypothetical protein